MLSRNLIIVVASVCLASSAAAQARKPMSSGQQKRVPRYDAAIADQANKIIAADTAFKNVKAEVEDAVVTLTGSVELHSDRQYLERKIKSIAHVSRVENKVVLSPPAMTDENLLAKVKSRLASEPRFAQLNVQVHEGMVTVAGDVRSQGDYSRVMSLLWGIEGVKEVNSRVRVMEDANR